MKIRIRSWMRCGEWEESGDKRKFMVVDAEHLAFGEYEPLCQLIIDIPDQQYFMLSTGLRDKNNREIFEGDIICEKNTNKIILGVVIWYSGTMDMNGEEYAYLQTGFAVTRLTHKESREEENRCSIAARYDFVNYGGNGDFEADRIEVIGNIHQNPELLNEPV